MKRKSLFSVMALLLCAISLIVTSCSKDDAVPDVNYVVKLDMPINVNTPVLKNGTATLTNVQNGSTYAISNFTLSHSTPSITKRPTANLST